MNSASQTLRVSAIAGAVLFASMLLAGCGQHAGDAGQAQSDTASSAQPNAADQARQAAEDEKYNGYVSSYNGLADQYGLVYEAQPYLSKSLDKIGANGTIRFNFGSDKELKSLKQAREVQSDAYPQLDGIADALIKDLQAVSEIHVQHRTYYATNAYRDDNFVLARQLDPQIRAAYADAMAQFEKFDGALAEAEEARNERDLAKLKALPNQLPYATKHVIVLSKQVLDASVKAVGGKGEPDFTRADAIKPQLYAALEFMDKQIEQHKTPDNGLSSFGMVLTDARNVLSTYGELRQVHGVEREHKLQLLLNAYNQMVSQANQI